MGWEWGEVAWEWGGSGVRWRGSGSGVGWGEWC